MFSKNSKRVNLAQLRPKPVSKSSDLVLSTAEGLIRLPETAVASDDWLAQCRGPRFKDVLMVKAIRPVVAWDAKPRLRLWKFLIEHRSTVRFAMNSAGDPTNEPTAALLACCPDAKKPQRFGVWLRSYLEVVALSPSEETAASLGTLRKGLASRQIACETLAQLLGKVADIRRIIKGDAHGPSPEATVRASLKSIADDLPPELRVPPGYILSPRGVAEVARPADGQEATTVCDDPLLIMGRSRERLTGEQFVCLVWFADGEWHEATVSREVIADRRRILEVAKFGAPITSANADRVVEYLDEFERVNRSILRLTHVAQQFGWQGGNGRDGFLLGQAHLRPVDKVQEGAATASQPPVDRTVCFRGRDGGEQQLADGYRHQGRFSTWAQAVARVMDYPRVGFGLYASFAAPMIQILGIPNFCVDFAGETTGGKTTVLTLAASVWGCVDDASSRSLVRRCDATSVWLERYATVHRDIPIFIDETKLARSTNDLRQLVYSFSTGRGRGRGSVRGLQEQLTYRSILFTSGEQPITSFSADGGTRPRVLSLWGSPFGQKSHEIGRLINEVVGVIRRNYGHTGPRWVQFLLNHRGRWKSWRKRHGVLQRQCEERASNVFARRQAPAWAALQLTAELVHEALPLPWQHRDPVTPLIEDFSREASGADQALEALKVAIDFFAANSNGFFGKHDVNRPPYKWYGQCSESRTRIDEETGGRLIESLGFIPAILREQLTQRGFEADATLRAWKDRGWIETGGEKGRLTVKRPVAQNRVNVIALTTLALASV